MTLEKYGFRDRFKQEAIEHPGLFPARVTEQRRDIYTLVCEAGNLRANVSGSDLCADLAVRLTETHAASAGVPVIVCSSENGDGFDEVDGFIEPDKTIAFVGSSGVGKSTLINRQTEAEKINRMFGGKKERQQFRKSVKER
jgi:ethanolamine utilization protein EutP (predicted NTPase)